MSGEEGRSRSGLQRGEWRERGERVREVDH